jgi:hypothetical protein
MRWSAGDSFDKHIKRKEKAKRRELELEKVEREML